MSTNAEGLNSFLPGIPDLPRLLTVTADDVLPDGSEIAGIDANGVLVRDGATDPRRLLSTAPERDAEEPSGFILFAGAGA